MKLIRLKKDMFVAQWRKKCIVKVLKGDVEKLSRAFIWKSSPQGYGYWYARYLGNQKLTQEDREYLFSLLL